MRRRRSILLLILIPGALGAAALSGVWSGSSEHPGSVPDAESSFETGMPSEDPCASEEASPACIHADDAARAGYPGLDSAVERYGPDRLPPVFRSAAPHVGEVGGAPRLTHVRAPSLEISPESVSADRPIRLADLGGLRGGAGGAKTRPAPGAQGTEDGMPPAGDPAEDPGSGHPAGDDQGGGSDAGVHPDVSNPETSPNPGSDAEESESMPEQNTDAGQEMGQDTDTGEEPGHGAGPPLVPTYPEGPFDSERPLVQVPEPGTLGLLIVGLLGCAARRRTARGGGSRADRED